MRSLAMETASELMKVDLALPSGDAGVDLGGGHRLAGGRRSCSSASITMAYKLMVQWLPALLGRL